METIRVPDGRRAIKRVCVRASHRNQCGREWLGEGEARDNETCKTNPIVPSLPNGAARCAFARCGAQRAQEEKFEQGKIFCLSILASWRAWRYWSYLVR
jgi:hypothetical protein